MIEIAHSYSHSSWKFKFLILFAPNRARYLITLEGGGCKENESKNYGILELVRNEVENVRLFGKDFESHERVMATTSLYDSCCPYKGHSKRWLKAHDHSILRCVIGGKGGDRPSSLHTRRWRSKGPKEMDMDVRCIWISKW